MSEGSASSNGLIGVLICDDDEDVRSLLRIVIGRNGDMEESGLVVVGDARDGDEAVSEAKRLQPDVILLDLSMPRRTGLEALPEIKEVAPAARVIAFSGFDHAMIVSDILSRGADRYLEKGAHPSAITAAIEEVAALGQPA